jgi:single-strand DNA-binding protein
MLKITAIGNLTNDIELKTNAEGRNYAILRIASDRRYRDRDGNRLTDFISIKVRDTLAERCAQYAYKGCKIAASGDFETITFADDPTRQPGFLIKGYEVEFLSPRKADETTEDVAPEAAEEMPATETVE